MGVLSAGRFSGVLSAGRFSTAVVIAAALAAACGPRDDATIDTTRGAATASASRPAVGSTDSAVAAGGNTASLEAGESAAPPSAQARPPLPHARDRDQTFLREMLDHHETVIALAHDQMMAPAGHEQHGVASDPGSLDSSLDAEKLEMLALLDSLYQEKYSPRAAVPAKVGSAAAGTAAEEYRARLAAQFRAGVALVDRFRPVLRRPRIRAAADRIRESQLSQLRLLGETPAAH